MVQNKTIRWNISQEHIESQNPLGFKVELSEDESFQRICFIHNTFDGVDNFTYDNEGSIDPYPETGILNPILGSEIQLPYESEKLMRSISFLKDGKLCRASPDGERILDSLDIDTEDLIYLSTDELRNEIWLTKTDGIDVFETPLNKIVKSFTAANDLAVIVDGARKSFWSVSSQELVLKGFDGEIIKSWDLPFNTDKVLSHLILKNTGNIYITLETSDLSASSSRYLVFCEFNGTLEYADAVDLDKKIGCLSEWTFDSVLTAGNGSELLRWIGAAFISFTDLNSDGVSSVLSLSAKKDDTIYIVNEINYLMAFDSSTLSKQWEIELPGTLTKSIQPMFNGEKSGRPILFGNNDYVGIARDSLTSSPTQKNLLLDGSGDAIFSFCSLNKPAIAHIRISAIGPT